jgi:hypothetical protein
VPGTIASVTGSPLDELLAAVDVVRCSGDRCVRHEMDGERRDVVRTDHAPDRQRRAELLAPRVQLIAEQRRRQRRVDEAGRDKVDADGRKLEGERLGERRYRGGERRDERARSRPATARSADEQERSAVAARLCKVDVGEPRVVRATGGDQDVVDRGRQLVEEPLEALEVGGVERRTAQRTEFVRGVLDAFRIAAGENQLGPSSACSPTRFEPDAGATADDDDGLPEEFRFALDERGGCRCS